MTVQIRKARVARFRVVPDGIIFDHVGEFAYSSEERIRLLYRCDPYGYRDAVMKVVQTLACSEKLLSGTLPPATEATGILKERLKQAERLDQEDFFGGLSRADWKDAGNRWVSDNWYTICTELEDRNCPAETSMSGHLQREFYYFWLRLDPNWNPTWYSPEGESLRVPEGLLRRLLDPVSKLAQELSARDKDGRKVTDDVLRGWICQNLTSHFRIFGEYMNCLGKGSRDEYMPALTRSCLKFLKKPKRHSKIETIVMPYVGLEALKNVTTRGDVVERVVEWSESEGKRIVDGLRELQWAFRNSQADEQKRILSDVQAILKSNDPTEIEIQLKLIKVSWDPDPQTVKNSAITVDVEPRRLSSYRWLWEIRDPAASPTFVAAGISLSSSGRH